METFNELFTNWINKKSKKQISKIDKICTQYDIDPSIWWLIENSGDWAGADFFNQFLDDFIGYIDTQFENYLLRYLPSKVYTLDNKPYISVDYILEYKKNKFYIDKSGKKEWKKKFKELTLVQKTELMKEKLFSDIVNQTNLKIFSKKDIRVLKLKNLNEYSKYH